LKGGVKSVYVGNGRNCNRPNLSRKKKAKKEPSLESQERRKARRSLSQVSAEITTEESKGEDRKV